MADLKPEVASACEIASIAPRVSLRRDRVGPDAFAVRRHDRALVGLRLSHSTAPTSHGTRSAKPVQTMNVQSPSSVSTLISGLQSEAIDRDADADASLVSSAHAPGFSRHASPRAMNPTNAAPRRRMANDARALAAVATIAPGSVHVDHVELSLDSSRSSEHTDFDADAPKSVRARGEALMTSSRERFDRLVRQAKARPQIALGAVAAAGIVVTTLVWTKVGRLMLLAAGGFVADRMYGKPLRRTVKRLAKKLPAQLTR